MYQKDERPPVVAVVLRSSAAAPQPAATVVASRPTVAQLPGTRLQINGQAYRLRIQARTDSARPLTAAAYVSNDDQPRQRSTRVRGYDSRFTFTLWDAAGQQVFQRQLRKADFAKMGSPDIMVESAANLPNYLGYSTALEALIFTVEFAVPDSDDGFQVVMLLSLNGQLLRLSEGRAMSGGPDCAPALSGNGRAVLTSSEVLRPGQPPLRLARPNADLAGAFFLTDSTLLTVYDPGKNRPVRLPDGFVSYERRVTLQQQQAPNSFVLHVGSGRVISSFRYKGYYEGMGYSLPHQCLRATKICYLLDEKRGLYLLPTATAGPPVTLKFAEMPQFIPPQRSQEIRFEMQGDEAQFAFYADTTNPRHIRYQRLQD